MSPLICFPSSPSPLLLSLCHLSERSLPFTETIHSVLECAFTIYKFSLRVKKHSSSSLFDHLNAHVSSRKSEQSLSLQFYTRSLSLPSHQSILYTIKRMSSSSKPLREKEREPISSDLNSLTLRTQVFLLSPALPASRVQSLRRRENIFLSVTFNFTVIQLFSQ